MNCELGFDENRMMRGNSVDASSATDSIISKALEYQLDCLMPLFFSRDVRDKDKNKWEITCEPLRLIHREVILYKICDDCPYNQL